MWAGNTNNVKNSHNLLSKYLSTSYFLLEALKMFVDDWCV